MSVIGALLVLGLLATDTASGHTMYPLRLEVPSGVSDVIAVVTVKNQYTFQDRFAIDCYKGDTGHNRIPCDALPNPVILSPQRSKRVKVRMPVDGDGLYRICSIEDPDEKEQRQFITKICAIVGVGVPPVPSPSRSPKHRPATNAMATGNR